MTFTKLFSSITESTVWCESAPTKIVWITMLAMCDKRGRVWASIPGLASRAKVTIDETETALSCFLSPDKYSRTQDHEGRKIEVIDGGWSLLNHAKYRALRDEEERRNYKTVKQREYRAVDNVDNVDKSGQPCTAVDAGGHNAEADTYTEAINKEAWSLYVVHRKELKARCLTPRGATMAMNKLAKLSHNEQMKVVENTIENGWIGLFTEKVTNGKHKESFGAKLAQLRRRAGLDAA
jgi:hypothetical protein